MLTSTRTNNPMTAPATPQDITIWFEKGAPVKVVSDEKEITGSLELFMALNEIGKIHGIGRIDIVEVSDLSNYAFIIDANRAGLSRTGSLV